MKDDLKIPSFLARTETDAQAEARRKKLAPKNESKGLKVITPPDPKISAAIAKDFVEKGQKAQAAVNELVGAAKLAASMSDKDLDWQIANAKKTGTEKLASIFKAERDKRAKAPAKGAVEVINEARAKDGLRPYEPNKPKLSSLTSIPNTAGKSDAARARRARDSKPVGKKEAALREQRESKATAPKKAGSLVDKALKARDELAAKAKAAAEQAKSKSASKGKSAEKKPAKSTAKKPSERKPREGTIAAKMFTDAKIDTAKKLITRKGGALSSEIQKACGWKPIIVRRFVRDIARKKLRMSVICDRSTGHDSTYKL